MPASPIEFIVQKQDDEHGWTDTCYRVPVDGQYNTLNRTIHELAGMAGRRHGTTFRIVVAWNDSDEQDTIQIAELTRKNDTATVRPASHGLSFTPHHYS